VRLVTSDAHEGLREAITNVLFRTWEPEQRWLLPTAVQEFVPPGHVAHFVRELVREELDLSAILAGYDDEHGQPPITP
jgi:hypothetical protein